MPEFSVLQGWQYLLSCKTVLQTGLLPLSYDLYCQQELQFLSQGISCILQSPLHHGREQYGHNVPVFKKSYMVANYDKESRSERMAANHILKFAAHDFAKNLVFFNSAFSMTFSVRSLAII